MKMRRWAMVAGLMSAACRLVERLQQQRHYAPLGVHWSAKSGVKGVPEMLSFDIVDGNAYLVVVNEDLEEFCFGKPKGTYLMSVYR